MLRLSRKQKPVRDRVQVSGLNEVTRKGTDVCDIETDSTANLALYAEAEAIDGRNLAVPSGAGHIRPAQIPAAGQEVRDVLDITAGEHRVGRIGRILEDRVVNQIALNPVIDHAEPAAEDGPAVAGHSISETEARPEHDAAVVAAASWVTCCSLAHAVGQADRIGRIIESRIEDGNLIFGVVLRLIPTEAQAVVQRQARIHFECILGVPLQVGVAEKALWTPVRLLEPIVVTKQSVRPRVACGIHLEMKLAVVIAPGRLILSIALEEEAGLKGVRAPYLAQVIGDVDSGVRVLERHCAQVSPGPLLSKIPNAVHLEIRDGDAGADREWQRDCRYFRVIGAADITVLSLNVQLRHARSYSEFVDQR